MQTSKSFVGSLKKLSEIPSSDARKDHNSIQKFRELASTCQIESSVLSTDPQTLKKNDNIFDNLSLQLVQAGLHTQTTVPQAEPEVSQAEPEVSRPLQQTELEVPMPFATQEMAPPQAVSQLPEENTDLPQLQPLLQVNEVPKPVFVRFKSWRKGIPRYSSCKSSCKC